MIAALLLSIAQGFMTVEAELAPPGLEAGDKFGHAADIEGEQAVVGAPFFDTGHGSHGAVFVFERHGSTWSETAVLAPPNIQNSYLHPFVLFEFGRCVDIRGDRLLVGAPKATTFKQEQWSAYPTGLAFLFRKGPAGWHHEATFDPREAAKSSFGSYVQLGHDRLLVSNGRYIAEYTLLGGKWILSSELTAPSLGTGQESNTAQMIELVGDTLFVASTGGDGAMPGTGVVLLYQRTGSSWSLSQIVYASDGFTGDRFGHCLASDGQTLLVGAQNAAIDLPWYPKADLIGAVYVFKQTGGGWVQEQKLVTPGFGQFQWAGTSVCLVNDRMAYAIPGNGNWTTQNGVLQVLERSAADEPWSFGTKWSPVEDLTHGIASSPRLGEALASSEGRLIVGAPGSVNANGKKTGRAFIVRWPTSELDAVPLYFCAPKPDSHGCVPQIFQEGQASVGGSQTGAPFVVGAQFIRTVQAPPAAPAMLYFSTHGRASIPFAGTTLCLAPPLLRSSPVYLKNWTWPCFNSVLFDFHAILASGNHPGLVAGQSVWFQIWYRDHGFPPPNDSVLTGGVTATIGP